jgi:hypothetical protein
MPTTNAGIFRDTLANVVGLITAAGYTPVTDPRNARPKTVFVELPTWSNFNPIIADVTIRLRVLGAPPGNQDVSDYLLTAAAELLDVGLSIVSGEPSVAVIGTQELPAYDLVVRVQSRYIAPPPPPPPAP